MFTALSVLSFLICLATVAMCVRSYWVIDHCIYQPTRDSYDAYFERGSICIRWMYLNGWTTSHWRFNSQPPQPRAYLKVTYPPPESTERRFGGFWYEYGSIINGPWKTGRLPYCALILPCWGIALTSVVLPVSVSVIAFRARRRQRQGFCPSCGYDLRATPDRCPECGTVTKPAEIA